MSEGFTETGALRLVKIIMEYWAIRGAKPHVYVATDGGSLRPDRGGTIFVVRSDMVNGLPRPISNVGSAA